MTTPTAVIIGAAASCRCLQRQLDLLDSQPRILGWITTDNAGDSSLGKLNDLETIVSRVEPDLALVSLPSVMSELVSSVRTRLRKLGVADRFMPMLEDQLAGIGPRSEIAIDAAALLNRPPREIDEQAIATIITGKRVAITGAGGSIGSELSRIVSQFSPSRLVLIDRSENALFEIDRQIARFAPQVERAALLHDVVDAPATLRYFEQYRPQIVFHAAAHKHVPMMEDHPAAAVENNIFGTVSAVDAAVAVGAERFVMISSDKAVNPSSIMGATKRLAEVYVQHVNRRCETGCSMVRFGNVLGSSGSVIETWRRQIAEGGPVTVTHPAMTRYFMTIPEAASLVIQSAALLDIGFDDGEVFLLDMGEPVRIVDLARRLIQRYGLVANEGDAPLGSATITAAIGRNQSPQDRFLAGAAPNEIDIIFTGARPGEKLFEELACDGQALRPTRHPDIQIRELPVPDNRYIQQMFNVLSMVRSNPDQRLVAETVRRLVPEMTVPLAA